MFWLARHVAKLIFAGCIMLGVGITFVIYALSSIIGNAITKHQMKRDRKKNV